mgnify:CR=1 FL=1
MNIAIRVNASNREGAGHFNRTLVLAKHLKKNNSNIYFLSNNLHKNYINLLNKNNFRYIFIKGASSGNYELNDINFTIKALKKINKVIDLIILDSYVLGFKWEKKLTHFTKKLMVIDDIDRKHFCDLYVSPFIKPKKNNILKKNCKVLVGLKYLIIKPTKVKKITKKNNKVLIYMGDADNKNLTIKLLRVLRKKIFDDFSFKILIGNTNINKFKILNNANKNKNVSCSHFQNSLSEILSKIDLTITSGGSTIFELIANKIPTLIICQNFNQYKLIKNNKICNPENILGYNKHSTKYLVNFLKKKLLESKIKLNKNKFDFLGSKRISKYI